jgi:flap endonuclease-1
MSLYQFLIAVRQEGNQLTSADGETTSHLLGFFYRTIRMVENGIKPVYVFDGKPPQMKSGELEKRTEKREVAQKVSHCTYMILLLLLLFTYLGGLIKHLMLLGS